MGTEDHVERVQRIFRSHEVDRSPESMEAVFDLIKRIHSVQPDLRVGQIISNALSFLNFGELFYVENKDLEAALNVYYERCR